MTPEHGPPEHPRVFLDTSALFAAVLSATGGARLLLKLGEAGAIRLWVGPRVLAEADAVLERKAPDLRPAMALLLDRAEVQVAPVPDASTLSWAQARIHYVPDAHILAEAAMAAADYLVTFDRTHFVGNPALASDSRLRIGTAGDCLAWLRERGLAESP